MIEGRIEVAVEPRVQRERVASHLDDVNLVIALCMNLAETVFVQEVIGDHEAQIIFGQVDVMRAGADAEITTDCWTKT